MTRITATTSTELRKLPPSPAQNCKAGTPGVTHTADGRPLPAEVQAQERRARSQGPAPAPSPSRSSESWYWAQPAAAVAPRSFGGVAPRCFAQWFFSGADSECRGRRREAPARRGVPSLSEPVPGPCQRAAARAPAPMKKKSARFKAAPWDADALSIGDSRRDMVPGTAISGEVRGRCAKLHHHTATNHPQAARLSDRYQ